MLIELQKRHPELRSLTLVEQLFELAEVPGRTGCDQVAVGAFQQFFDPDGETGPAEAQQVEGGILLSVLCSDGRYWIRDNTQPKATKVELESGRIKPCAGQVGEDCKARLKFKVRIDPEGEVVYRQGYRVTARERIDRATSKALIEKYGWESGEPLRAPKWLSYWVSAPGGIRQDLTILEEFSGYEGTLVGPSFKVGSTKVGRESHDWTQEPLEGASVAVQGNASTVAADGRFELKGVSGFAPFSVRLKNHRFEVLTRSSRETPPEVASRNWRAEQPAAKYEFGTGEVADQVSVQANVYHALARGLDALESRFPPAANLIGYVTACDVAEACDEESDASEACAAALLYGNKIFLPFECPIRGFVPRGACPEIVFHELVHALSNELTKVVSGGKAELLRASDKDFGPAFAEAVSDFLAVSLAEDPVYARVCANELREIDRAYFEGMTYRSWLEHNEKDKTRASLAISSWLWAARQRLVDLQPAAGARQMDLLVLLSLFWRADDPYSLLENLIFFADEVLVLEAAKPALCESAWSPSFIFHGDCLSIAEPPFFKLGEARPKGDRLLVEGTYVGSRIWPRFEIEIIERKYQGPSSLGHFRSPVREKPYSDSGRLAAIQFDPPGSNLLIYSLRPVSADGRTGEPREFAKTIFQGPLWTSPPSATFYRAGGFVQVAGGGPVLLVAVRDDEHIESWRFDPAVKGELSGLRQPVVLPLRSSLDGAMKIVADEVSWLSRKGAEVWHLDADRGLESGGLRLFELSSGDRSVGLFGTPFTSVLRIPDRGDTATLLDLFHNERDREILIPEDMRRDLSQLVSDGGRELLLTLAGDKATAFELDIGRLISTEAPQPVFDATSESGIQVNLPDGRAHRYEVSTAGTSWPPYHRMVYRRGNSPGEGDVLVTLGVDGRARIMPLDGALGTVVELGTLDPLTGEAVRSLGSLEMGNESPIGFGDVDGDGENEIILGSFNTRIVGQNLHYILAFELSGSELRDGWPIYLERASFSPVLTQQLDSDPCAEIILLSDRIEIWSPECKIPGVPHRNPI